MYKCLSHSFYGDPSGYALIPIHADAMEKIRLWRNAQLDVLRQKEAITADEQKAYFKEHIAPTFNEEHPSQILFSFLYHHHPIGYGGLTHIDWQQRKAEVSFLLDPAELTHYAEKFSAYLKLLAEIAFNDLKLKKLFTETYAFRQDHIAVLEQGGYVLEDRLKNHVMKNGKYYDALFHGLSDAR